MKNKHAHTHTFTASLCETKLKISLSKLVSIRFRSGRVPAWVGKESGNVTLHLALGLDQSSSSWQMNRGLIAILSNTVGGLCRFDNDIIKCFTSIARYNNGFPFPTNAGCTSYIVYPGFFSARGCHGNCFHPVGPADGDATSIVYRDCASMSWPLGVPTSSIFALVGCT